LRLEVKYPDKPPHEVDLKVSVAVVGRDPSCDLVVSDERCSRRHAVLEDTPTGLQVRDAGSANGIFVNGKKVERSPLVKGDLVRLGEVILKVLAAEEMPGTLVMGDDDLVDLGATPALPSRASAPRVPETAPLGEQPAARPPASRAPSANPAPRPPSGDRAAHRDPIPSTLPRTVARKPGTATAGRPLTVTVLAGLWLVSIVLYAAAALGAAPLYGLSGMAAGSTIGGATLLAVLSGLMAYGLFNLKPWARLLQAVVAGLGLLVCPFTLASATTLIYVLRPGTRSAFGSSPEGSAPDSADMTFALTLIGTVVVGAALCLAGILFARYAR
jgi:hypothetical protein